MGRQAHRPDGTIIEPDLELAPHLRHQRALDALECGEHRRAVERHHLHHSGCDGRAPTVCQRQRHHHPHRRGQGPTAFEIVTDTRANELIVENGKVVGVKATTSEGANVTPACQQRRGAGDRRLLPPTRRWLWNTTTTGRACPIPCPPPTPRRSPATAS